MIIIIRSKEDAAALTGMSIAAPNMGGDNLTIVNCTGFTFPVHRNIGPEDREPYSNFGKIGTKIIKIKPYHNVDINQC